MKKRNQIILIVIFIIALLVLGIFANKSWAQEKEFLTGFVKAVQWQDEEVIAAVLVVTTDEEDDEGKHNTYIDEFTILDDSIGMDLFKFYGETVEINGTFVEEDDELVYLKVISFRVIESSDEDLNEEDLDEDEIDELSE